MGPILSLTEAWSQRGIIIIIIIIINFISIFTYKQLRNVCFISRTELSNLYII